MNLSLQAACATALALVAAGSASAQQATCTLKFDSPGELKSAYNTVALAQVGGRSADQQKRLQAAVKALTENPGKFRDPAARNLVLGELLVLWSAQPGVDAAAAPRATIGYGTNPQGTVDLYAAADSAFRAVEQSNPACTSETEPYRQRAWGVLINPAGALINSNNADSAAVLLEHANTIYGSSPYTYYYLAAIAQQRNDRAATVANLQKVLDLSTPEAIAADTSIRPVREYAKYSIGVAQLQQADSLQGAARQSAMAQAAQSFQAYLQEFPNGENAGRARSALATALQQSGDTAGVAKLGAEMLANPAAYSDFQLFDAATAAFQAKNEANAAKLFEAGLQKNPYYRPALFNLVNTYFAMKQWDRMLATAKTLVQVDPDNPDNWQLLALATENAAKSLPAAAKGVQMDSARAYLDRSAALPARVNFTDFSRRADSTSLSGTVENLGKAAKTFTLRFDFLDGTGAVVASKEATVKVGPKGSPTATGEFTVGIPQQAAAFRYQPIS